MHNGGIDGYRKMRRDLVTAVEPDLFPELQGSTDSEVLFYLALTFGLTDDPIDGVAQAVGFVEEVGRAHGVDHPVQMTVATTDGDTIWIFRYSTVRQSRSLFYSTDMAKLQALHPEVEALRRLGGLTRFVVSEPLRDLPGLWNEVPEHLDAHRVVGRVAVRADRRGDGLARDLMDAALGVIDGERAASMLHAQSYVVGLYERFGYAAFGDEYDEAGIPHRSMYRPAS